MSICLTGALSSLSCYCYNFVVFYYLLYRIDNPLPPRRPGQFFIRQYRRRKTLIMGTLRILSGMRPTGKLHLGHYTGALENWVQLQNLLADDGSKVYETCFLIADYHILSTSLDTSEAYQHSMDMLIQVRDLNMESLTYGHLGYPVLQAADILLYKGNVVPVGEDQIPHVEITREIARKFNFHFPHPTIGEVFPEPEPKITKFSRLVGLDGKAKMSKSLGNTVLLSDTPEEVFRKVRNAVTDTGKIRKNDPGCPEVCTVFSYHKRFTAPEEVAEIETECRSGALGCVDCKKRCAASISAELEPLLEKRRYYEERMDLVRDILLDGEKKARALATHTMQEVRTAMMLG